MLFAESETIPIAWIIGGIVTVVASVASAVVTLHKMLMAAKDAHIKTVESQRDSYKEIGDEAATRLEQVTNELLVKRGRKKITPMAAVKAEHNSPTTPEQQETADMATLRARVVAAAVAVAETHEVPVPDSAPPLIKKIAAIKTHAEEVAAELEEAKALAKALVETDPLLSESTEVLEQPAPVPPKSKENWPERPAIQTPGERQQTDAEWRERTDKG